uniref:Uncharacterized protein n=1 Tax=Romanomermis culicivorax TaxID=13658 RepID=A0A915JUA3_ROMCU
MAFSAEIPHDRQRAQYQMIKIERLQTNNKDDELSRIQIWDAWIRALNIEKFVVGFTQTPGGTDDTCYYTSKIVPSLTNDLSVFSLQSFNLKENEMMILCNCYLNRYNIVTGTDERFVHTEICL